MPCADAQRLVEKLGAYPLALSQTGRYMYETSTSYDGFLKVYETRLQALIKQEPSRREYQNGSIKAALELSFEALKARDAHAAAFLLLLGYFDHSNVSPELLTCNDVYSLECPHFNNIANLPETWLDNLRTDRERFEVVIRSLLAFSFVNRDMGSESISIHPVVHEWTLSISKDSRLSCISSVSHIHLCTHYQVWKDGLLESQKGRGLLSRVRPHLDRCIKLAEQDDGLSSIAPEDLVFLGTYYVSLSSILYLPFMVFFHSSRISNSLLVRLALALCRS